MTGPTKGLKAVGGDALTDIDMEEEVKIAFEAVKNIDVLDVTVGKSRFRSPLACVSLFTSHPPSLSSGGTEIWVTAETAYNERVARVENQIIARLRDRLGTARNANEMFRVFSKFNTLLVRQKVRRNLSIPSSVPSR
jgi:dynein heavy chain 1